LRTQFDSSHVAHANNGAIGPFAHNDLPKFFRRYQAALRKDRIGEFLALGRRFAPGFSRRVNGVLRLDGANMSGTVMPSLDN